MNWDHQIAGVAAWRIGSLFAAIFVALVAGRLARYFLEARARTMATTRPGMSSVLLRAAARAALPLAFAGGMWAGIYLLNTELIAPRLAELLNTAVDVALAASTGYAVYCLVDIVDHYLSGAAARTESKVNNMLAPLVGKSLRVTVVILVAVQLVHELSDKPVTAIVTSLGVGGLAIALAGQDAIKNFFGSLVILGDKPFEIGDRIVIDGHDGPVEAVGFRSTKIRTLDGHLVSIPNADITNRAIRNVGKRPYIRRLANITITYDTPPHKVDKAITILKDILQDHEGMDPEFPPRVFFNEFNDCSLNLLMIYWYHPPDYWRYLEYTERVNREILSRFNEEGIEFAFPTQTVHLAKGSDTVMSPGIATTGTGTPGAAPVS